MGIRGAALATALGPIFSVVILLPHFLARRGELYFAPCRPRLSDAVGILACGTPSFVMEFSIGIVTFLYNIAVTRWGYGELGLAAYLVIGYLMLIIMTLFLGMAEGLQPVFSRLSAAGEENRALTMRRFSAKVFLGVGAVCYGLILLGSRWFFLLFAPADPELVNFAVEKSVLYFCGFFLTGFNILMIAYWQAVQQTGRALVAAVLRSVVLPPLLLLVLPTLLEREIIWVCQSAADALTACCIMFALAHMDKRQTGRP